MGVLMPSKPRSAASAAQRDVRGNTADRRRRREWLVENYRANIDMLTVVQLDNTTRRYPATNENVAEAEALAAVNRLVSWVVESACRCYRCGKLLAVDTVTADRFPIPGCKGGRYVPGNMRPACGVTEDGPGCNVKAGSGLRGDR